VADLTSSKIIPLLHLSLNAYKSLDPFSILACKPTLEHYFVGVKIIFFLLERKYGYLWFECSSSDSPTTVKAVRHEAIKKLWVPLTLSVHQKVQMVWQWEK
jgi:hypothetical protein